MIRGHTLCKLTLAAVLMVSPAGLRAQQPAAPPTNYWIYVGAESADLIHRVRFGPGGAVVEKNIPVG